MKNVIVIKLHIIGEKYEIGCAVFLLFLFVCRIFYINEACNKFYMILKTIFQQYWGEI